MKGNVSGFLMTLGGETNWTPENGFDDEGECFGLLDDTGRGDEQKSDVLPLKSLGQSESPFFAPCLMVHYEYKSNHLLE